MTPGRGRRGPYERDPRRASDPRDIAVRRDLRRLVGLLVDERDAVAIDARPGRGDTLFEVRVGPDDLGKVIGRQGRTARALRALLEVRGTHDGRRYGLEIREA